MVLPEVEGGQLGGLAQVVTGETDHQPAVRRRMGGVQRREWPPLGPQSDQIPVRLRRQLGWRAYRRARGA